MHKLHGPTAGKLLTDRMVRVSMTAERVDFGALGPPASSLANVSAVIVPVDDGSDRKALNDVHQPLPTREARGGTRVAEGSIRP
ncbi:hypothetical protein PYH37_002012 [Sinorhizobium numidicum]|uniref:Uncharacterized protein n=1 Tax=Sinorhizobium numidicum TaxID=680248 RepID=A0ABY8CV11_9HYPH|nr:hypothetical protein [Sinorhizobium numidicum]WEX74573.1 hypothetical protein PYH37_002012 [Sinorhizobium numidicum]WEX80563.1 hypothetical protein PYH38_002014 [Sinorhizobium numidicum]